MNTNRVIQLFSFGHTVTTPAGTAMLGRFGWRAGLVLLLFWVIGVIGFFSFQAAFPPHAEASFTA